MLSSHMWLRATITDNIDLAFEYFKYLNKKYLFSIEFSLELTLR